MEASDEPANSARGGAFCVCLIFACVGAGQQTTKQGQILIGNTAGALVPTSPFSCYVDGPVSGGNANIAACVSLLGARSGGLWQGPDPDIHHQEH